MGNYFFQNLEKINSEMFLLYLMLKKLVKIKKGLYILPYIMKTKPIWLKLDRYDDVSAFLYTFVSEKILKWFLIGWSVKCSIYYIFMFFVRSSSKQISYNSPYERIIAKYIYEVIL